MIIGEQPGDIEDRLGNPFVGPAGKLLDEALRESGIDRSRVYLTSVVKHFKWSPAERGKRRIHKKPRYDEIKACRPGWMQNWSSSSRRTSCHLIRGSETIINCAPPPHARGERGASLAA
jgi:uracil-DNA glycosylase family 4